MPDNTIHGKRRRRSEPSESGKRKRAEAPRRGERETPQRPVSTPRPRPSGQTGTDRPYQTGGGGPQIPGGGGPQVPGGPQIPIGGLLNLFRGRGGRKLSPLLLIGLLALAVLCACLVFPGLLRSCVGGSGLGGFLPSQPSEPSQPGPFVEQPTSLPAATRTPRPAAPPAALPGGGQTWLVMLYQDADDKILERDIYVDLNEAERAGSGDRVHIVSQIDRYAAGYTGDGGWDSTKRFYVTLDSELGTVTSEEVADIGEANMADGQTLVDFVTWAIETYPADRHALILSDHGMGWPGGWTDPDPGGRGRHDIAMAEMGDQLFLMELDDALQEIRDRSGLEQFELVGMDACLMGHLEVFTMLAPHARYAVASQETEPALGWAYTSFLNDLRDNPDMDGAELGRLIVDSYIQDDQRIVDDQARAELLSRGSLLGGLFGLPSAQQVAQQMEGNVTLAAIDLSAIPALNARFNELAFALQDEGQSPVAQARSYAQSFTSIFGQEVPPAYLDLSHFVELLQSESGSGTIAEQAEAVRAAVEQAVLAERHGSKKSGATGISIYFPNSQIYQTQVAGAESYTTVAQRFASESLWDDFLAYHYTGKPFEMATGVMGVPERDATIEGPGTGAIQVSPVELSSDTAAPGQPVLMSTDISGQNIGYVLLFAGFYDQAANSIMVADKDYLEGEETREINGVYYPDWGSEDFTMAFEWEPIVFAINDGVDSVVAFFRPESFGATFEEAVYAVDGIYTYTDGESRYARLLFSNGVLTQIFGFTGEDGTGAPREITAEAGDTFTVLDTWWDLDENGNVVETVTLEGGTLTFGDETFTWEELDAAAGTYVVGFVVEDLDGNAYETLDVVTVE